MTDKHNKLLPVISSQRLFRLISETIYPVEAPDNLELSFGAMAITGSSRLTRILAGDAIPKEELNLAGLLPSNIIASTYLVRVKSLGTENLNLSGPVLSNVTASTFEVRIRADRQIESLSLSGPGLQSIISSTRLIRLLHTQPHEAAELSAMTITIVASTTEEV